jgi:cysteine desulfurase
MIYLDHNATTPVHPEVQRVIEEHLRTEFGNPSSSHVRGQTAKAALDAARGAVADMLGAARASDIVFTGGATESNNLALFGACAAAPPGRRHLVVGAIEHPSVIEPALALQRQGWKVSFAPAGRDGRYDLAALAALLEAGDAALVSIMHANNELGTVQPVAEVAALAKRSGALLHVDAAQSAGKVDVHVDALQADLLTLAGHKMYAPKGIGVLYVRDGTPLRPLTYGAAQEGCLRPGTENVAFAAGLGAAARMVQRAQPARLEMARLRDALQARLLEAIPGLTVNGSLQHRLPNTLHVSLPVGSARAVIAALAHEIALSPVQPATPAMPCGRPA